MWLFNFQIQDDRRCCMIEKIHHIGIAVSSLDERTPFYRDMLGLEMKGTEEIQEQKVRTAMFETGGVNVELLEPTSDESPIARFIEKRGEGIHHIAYQTGDIVQSIASLKDRGIRMIDEVPRGGVHGTSIAFLHPKATGGVLTELTELPQQETERV